MSKNVTFQLGPTTGISARQLTITRHMRAGDDAAPSPEHDADAGAVETVTVALPDNTVWEARLVDTLSTGEVLPAQIFSFSTGSLAHLGPGAGNWSDFKVLHMEDLSSSSSVSSSSQSSSSSSSSASSSSSSSLSSSSESSSSSSISTSSSSISTSSSSDSSSSDSSSSLG